MHPAAWCIADEWHQRGATPANDDVYGHVHGHVYSGHVYKDMHGHMHGHVCGRVHIHIQRQSMTTPQIAQRSTTAQRRYIASDAVVPERIQQLEGAYRAKHKRGRCNTLCPVCNTMDQEARTLGHKGGQL